MSRLISSAWNSRLLIFGVSLSVVPLIAGCTERREALGGGGRSPVKVTLLRSGGVSQSGSADESSAAVEAVAGFGTLKGRVVVNGSFNQRPPLISVGQAGVRDAVCTENGVPDESVVVNDGGLANVYIYLRRAPNIEFPPPPSDPVVLDQQGCKFVPHSAIARVGQTVRMINSDPAAHNIFMSALGFNQTISKGEEQLLPVRTAERNPITMTCSFHGWMTGNILFIDHPWAVISSADGTFEIPGVPAGPMEFVVWHEKLGLIERSLRLNIPVDGVLEQTIGVDAARLN